MIVNTCTWVGFLAIIIGSIGNWLCICVYFRKRFRSSILTPFFVALLIADCIYLTFRVIKLLYYQETLFDQSLFGSSCSSSLLIRIYGLFTQHAPQILIPLCHYELYTRFSLLLMSFLAIQRAYDMCRTSFRLIKRSSSSRAISFLLIIKAFIIAYVLEFFGLSIFCSNELSSNTAYHWQDYLYNNLSNETSHLMNFMLNQSANQTDIDCLINNRASCSHKQIADVARHYFDMHEPPILHLIHKIQLSTIGLKMARNELRLKYHYHTCLFRLQPDLFLKFFDILYARMLGFNRYTSILVVGSIIPSIITIFGNAISLRWILAIRNSVNEQSFASRRRTDETHRVIIIITTECILIVLSSWLIDIILSINYCHRSVAIGDDCPYFLRRYHAFLAFFDLLNSMSNILLYCYAGKRFRHELERMIKAWMMTMKKYLPCYCHWEWKKPPAIRTRSDDEHYFVPSETSLQPMKNSEHSTKKKHHYIKLKLIASPNSLL